MLPLYKLFSLIVRVFARPLVNYTKKYHISNQSNENNHLKRFFVWFGNLYHRIEMNINKRFLKMHSNYTYKPLNDELAVEKGIEIFYEIMIYAILIGFSVWEMVIGGRETAEKKKQLDERLNNYRVSLGVVEDNLTQLKGKFNETLESQKAKIRTLEEELKNKKASSWELFHMKYPHEQKGYVQQMDELSRNIGVPLIKDYRYHLARPF